MVDIYEMPSAAAVVISIVIAYFLGNISPATLLARAVGKDIKKEGSGNAGTTNALRVLGKKAALITLIVDIGKGFLAVKIGFAFAVPEAAMFCALAAFIGHIWPIIFKYKCGKFIIKHIYFSYIRCSW